MDIQAISVAVVALLGPYLVKAGEAFAEKAGEKLAEKVGELYQVIKKKFKGDTYAEQTLTRVEEKPEAKGRQDALIAVLAEKMQEDTNFAEKMQRLLEESEQVGGGDVIKQQLNISGKAEDVFQIGKMGGGITKGVSND
ncbi:MAG: hypothetical protein L6R45_34825 [Anaerolineae bacterium]|nr:hypothetical protein [Anaerolineae bacterium]